MTNKEARIFAEFKNGESTPYIVYTTSNDQEVIQLAYRISLRGKVTKNDILGTVEGALAYIEKKIDHNDCYLEVYDFDAFQEYEKSNVELPAKVRKKGKQLGWV
jgi:hypothetical protein